MILRFPSALEARSCISSIRSKKQRLRQNAAACRRCWASPSLAATLFPEALLRRRLPSLQTQPRPSTLTRKDKADALEGNRRRRRRRRFDALTRSVRRSRKTRLALCSGGAVARGALSFLLGFSFCLSLCAGESQWPTELCRALRGGSRQRSIFRGRRGLGELPTEIKSFP